jgi:hypothetical protein
MKLRPDIHAGLIYSMDLRGKTIPQVNDMILDAMRRKDEAAKRFAVATPAQQAVMMRTEPRMDDIIAVLEKHVTEMTEKAEQERDAENENSTRFHMTGGDE